MSSCKLLVKQCVIVQCNSIVSGIYHRQVWRSDLLSEHGAEVVVRGNGLARAPRFAVGIHIGLAVSVEH